jgi:hypothetical protein
MKTLKKGIGIAGSTTIDKIVAEDQIYSKLGGVTTYAGITYRRHGIPVLIASNLAERDLKIIKELETTKIEVFNDGAINYVADPVNFQVAPTGAGDVFFAAYIVGRFSNNMHIPEACRYAARKAAQQVEGKYITINQLGLN